MLSRAIVRQKPLFFKSKCEEMQILPQFVPTMLESELHAGF